MCYRTVTIRWSPSTRSEWGIFTSVRSESARLWSDLVDRHYRLRRRGLRWPTDLRWHRWVRGRYPNLSAQSAQCICSEFSSAVRSVSELRRNGVHARYPWRKYKYRDVPYSNQGAYLIEGTRNLRLGNSSCLGCIVIPIPLSVHLPGRIIRVRLSFSKVLVVCEVEDTRVDVVTTIGVDLGVNTLIAATDGERSICISGRELKANVQYRAKKLASAESKLSRYARRSRRWSKLQRRKGKLLTKSHNRQRDLIHKSTRKIVDEFPAAECYIGKPFNRAASHVGRVQSQQISQSPANQITQQLNYKTSGAIQVDEYYTSQTCPVCGVRNQCRRVYKCRECGTELPRDVVGALNILSIGQTGSLSAGRSVPNTIIWRYPEKYPRANLGSSGGPPASSSLVS